MSDDRRSSLWALLLLAAITAAGFWLRWRYAYDVPFFVDEYLQVRAAQRVVEQGVPLLPSGNFYSHGLLVSYLVAPLAALDVRALWLLRLPVLIMSTAAIPLAYVTGRRIFSPGAGLVAAALLAFAPEAILWGGRVRMYAPLQFCIQLATLLFFVWVVGGQDRPLYRWGFVLAYWGALFSHAEAMILLPLWGLWALIQRGLRWCLRPANLVAFALAGTSIVVEIGLRQIGPPVQAWSAPGVFRPVGREYLGLGLDQPGIQKIVEPLFLTPVRLPLVLLAAAGLVWLIVVVLRRRALPEQARQSEGAGAFRQGVAYLFVLLLPALAILLFGVTAEWKSPRYGLMLLPLFFVLAGGLLALCPAAGAGRAGLGRWLQARVPPSGPMRGSFLSGAAQTVIVVAIAAASWAPALAATRESVPDYRWALEQVEAQQQPGDVLITFLCQAALFELGRCDALAIPTDYQGFAFQQNGRWVSGWDKVPIVDSAESLRAILASAPQAWFVVDDGRFPRRYAPEFAQAVLDSMELVAHEREMLIFRSRRP